MAARGAFILFEGVDRCGKTTQATKLVEALTKAGQKAVLMRFPDRETTIGGIINKYLTKQAEMDDRSVHLLFSANRWEKSAQLLELLRGGTHVVMDRYAYSGVAFSSAKDVAGMTLDWCRAPDAGLPRPDVLFFMDIPVEKAAARGGFGEERYEDPVFQARVRARFDTLRVEASAAGGGGGGLDGGAGSPPPPIWVNVDAAGTIEAIHAHLMDLTREVVAQAAARPVRKLWSGEVL